MSNEFVLIWLRCHRCDAKKRFFVSFWFFTAHRNCLHWFECDLDFCVLSVAENKMSYVMSIYRYAIAYAYTTHKVYILHPLIVEREKKTVFFGISLSITWKINKLNAFALQRYFFISSSFLFIYLVSIFDLTWLYVYGGCQFV